MMMISSNPTKEPLTRASIEALVIEALEIYRKSNFYDLRKTMLEQYCDQLKECTSLKAIKEALKIYANKKDKRTNRIPHPNYFVKVALSLDDESKRSPIGELTNITTWGKVI